MSWVVGDGLYLISGFMYYLCGIAIDSLPFTEPQITCTDLLSPQVLSKLTHLDIEEVSLNHEDKISKGAGGTGTCRQSLIAKLTNGQTLYLFIKTPTTSILERAFMTLFKVYENELNFYSSLHKEFSQLDKDWMFCPEVYYVKKYGFTKFVIILEDLRYRSGGCSFKTTLELPYDINTTKAVLKSLSMMHAKYWQCPPASVWGYSPLTGMSNANTPPMLRVLAFSSLKKVFSRYGQKLQLHTKTIQAFHLGMTNYPQLRQYWSSRGLITMCHGDAHVGNTFLGNQTQKVGFVDFQCLSAEHFMRDVSYHLINSVPSDILQDIETELIQGYIDNLKESLVYFGHQDVIKDIPSFDKLYVEYRIHAIWSLIAWVICCGFSDVVMESFAIDSLQRALDTCDRLNILEVVEQVLHFK